MGSPTLAAACPRQIAENSVAEISLAGLGAALKIYINEESHHMHTFAFLHFSFVNPVTLAPAVSSLH
jgi:hypothetical protein